MVETNELNINGRKRPMPSQQVQHGCHLQTESETSDVHHGLSASSGTKALAQMVQRPMKSQPQPPQAKASKRVKTEQLNLQQHQQPLPHARQKQSFDAALTHSATPSAPLPSGHPALHTIPAAQTAPAAAPQAMARIQPRSTAPVGAAASTALPQHARQAPSPATTAPITRNPLINSVPTPNAAYPAPRQSSLAASTTHLPPTQPRQPPTTHPPHPQQAPPAHPHNPTPPTSRKESPPPLKACTFHHLQQKYGSELDYMLVEFRKLERQLLGAPVGQQQKKVESKASKERREKLHGFILHLEDTIRQITEGCAMETEKLQQTHHESRHSLEEEKKSSDTSLPNPGTKSEEQSTPNSNIPRKFTADFTAAEASLSNLPPEKEVEEAVQRLEEHVLANLLPVKVRLTRQLAAQKGAARNPVTAPIGRHAGGAGVGAAGRAGGSGTVVGNASNANNATPASFAEAAAAKRRAQEERSKAALTSSSATAATPAATVASASPIPSPLAPSATESTTATSPTNAAHASAPLSGASQSFPLAPSQYGRPLKAGSSLTTRLHGKILGSPVAATPCRLPPGAPTASSSTNSASSTPTATTANNDGNSEPTSTLTPTRRIFYAGMAPGSSQITSSISAVSGVHPGLVCDDAARAHSMAEEERMKLGQLEQRAARVALGSSIGNGAAVKQEENATIHFRSAGTSADAKQISAGAAAATASAASSTVPSASSASSAVTRVPKPIPNSTANAKIASTETATKPTDGPATLAARARAQQAKQAQQALQLKQAQKAALAAAAANAKAALANKALIAKTPACAVGTVAGAKPLAIQSAVPGSAATVENAHLLQLKAQQIQQQKQQAQSKPSSVTQTARKISPVVAPTKIPASSAVAATTLIAHSKASVAAASGQAQHFIQTSKSTPGAQAIRSGQQLITQVKKRYTQPNFNDPALTPDQQYQLRLEEARRRQRKRRRERRRRRLGISSKRTAGNPSRPEIDRHGGDQHGKHPHGEVMAHGHLGNISGGIAAVAPGTIGGVNGINGSNGIKTGVQNIPGGSCTDAKGPRGVEYVCAVCNEAYPSICEKNPWWALSSHDCPKCGKAQIPRLDISSPSNAIDYHPSLLSHLEDGNADGSNSSKSALSKTNGGTADVPVSAPLGMHVQGGNEAQMTPSAHAVHMLQTGANAAALVKRNSFSDSEVSHTDESDGEGGSGMYDEESSDDDDIYEGFSEVMTKEKRIEREEFGFEYKGDKLSVDQAKRLLVLIEHASKCPGKHQSSAHRNVCHSTKYLMLHVRDCSGLLSNGDVCPFPWCRKVKHLLYHLVTCQNFENGQECPLCNPENLSTNLKALADLNQHRRTRFIEKNINKISTVNGIVNCSSITAKVFPKMRKIQVAQQKHQQKRRLSQGLMAAQQRAPKSVTKSQNSLPPIPVGTPSASITPTPASDPILHTASSSNPKNAANNTKMDISNLHNASMALVATYHQPSPVQNPLESIAYTEPPAVTLTASPSPAPALAPPTSTLSVAVTSDPAPAPPAVNDSYGNLEPLAEIGEMVLSTSDLMD